MNKDIRFSSIRLFVVLYICASAVLLLFSGYKYSADNFISAVIMSVAGIALVFLYFIPSAYIKRKTNYDFISFVKEATPSGVIFVGAYYAMYFVFLATGFLDSYSDVFSKSLNPDANIYVVAFILLGACVYCASKGINILSRVAIFIFAFTIISYALIFGGNFANLNFSDNKIDFNLEIIDMLPNFLLISSIGFISVIFGFSSSLTVKYKKRQILLTLTGILLTTVLIIFFIIFAIGKYSQMQPYPAYVLSKSSHLGVVSGLDGIFLSMLTTSIFVLLSAILICTANTVVCKNNFRIIILFSVAIYILFICAQNFNAVKELLNNPYVLSVLNFISAIIIPVFYILVFRRRLNV